MAQSEGSEPDADMGSSFSVLLVVHLDTYTTTSVSNGGKNKTKETKSTKVKEVMITLTASNYLDLLTTMLAKHGKDTYKVTEKKPYSFKYLLPPAKVRGDAMDVDNATDFADMAKKLIESKPDKVKVFVNMKEVEKHPLQAKMQHDSTGDSNKAGPGSDLERAIAHFWRLIIKQWGNEYDNSVTYLHPTGVDIPCTPLMIWDWAIAMYEGTVTKLHPPNIQSFDPRKSAIALVPMCHLHTPAPGLSRDRNGPYTPGLTTISATSATPMPIVPQPQSPAIPTPLKLTRFLEYADAQLGVQNAMTYEYALHYLGAGPDILAKMSDSDVSTAGLKVT
ncbi:hypothetical protein PAXRUDRAFT_764893 [Paxillus rubicundulus Ve08.2h10]|uniref:Uncharacterized protein n=1 Tax=Paxillus rubicundulus Ve08.2h10 TaxID=930991 RepID=A0A0D0D9Y1_9AGAM|nr:hypothetical protein PAXRUDRAFT_764893 [Paxillus rubicundulus Ve08.2h10]